MQLFDRYINKQIQEKDLPEQIDFGRFFFWDSENKPVDITYSNFPTNKVIKQDLLLEKNKSLQDIFKDILVDIESAQEGKFEVIPLIRQIKNKLRLNIFEKLLNENVFHIEEVFRNPHYLLEREIEKVNVARAKRIPSKSYQYLASHTEDWMHKSIVSFKPIRILHEELDLNYDIYENQFTVVFLEKCLVYLNARLKEIQDIKLFLQDYEKLLKDRDDTRGWWKKINRNLALIGAVYNDENYHSDTEDGKMLSKTEDIITQIYKRLLRLRKSELFDVVNKKIYPTFRNTNVFVNHKHYRYIKELWLKYIEIKPEKTEKEKQQDEQDVIKGLRAYTTSLIAYTLKKYLEYELKGNYTKGNCNHLQYPLVEFTLDKNNIIRLEICEKPLKIIAIANEPSDITPITQDTILLYFSESSKQINQRIIGINPLDPDSCERVASFVRKYIIINYLNNLNQEYKYAQILKDFISIFQIEFLQFNGSEYSYRFIKCPKRLIEEDIKDRLEDNSKYKKDTHRAHKKEVKGKVVELIEDINTRGQKLQQEYLYCLHCGGQIQSYSVENLNYLKCSSNSCSFMLDSTNLQNIIFKNIDNQYNGLKNEDWGMDYINFNIEEL
jgi:hypothetical protein